MNAEKKITGYPSMDKPHYKYYRSEPIRKIEAEQTIYEMVFNANKDNMKDPAIEYMGKSWTFEHLKADTDKAADSFAKSGLKMGDVVLVGLASCYEVVIILGPHKTLLTVLPPWIAYGLINAIVLPLALGTKVILCPSFDANTVCMHLGKFTIAFAAPFHYRYISDNYNTEMSIIQSLES